MAGIIQYTGIGTGEFTKELLDQNFSAIGQYTVDAAKHIDSIESTVNDLVFQVSKLSKPTTTTKVTLTPFLVGAAIGIYIYRNRQKIKILMENANAGAQQRFTEPSETIKTEASRADKPTA